MKNELIFHLNRLNHQLKSIGKEYQCKNCSNYENDNECVCKYEVI